MPIRLRSGLPATNAPRRSTATTAPTAYSGGNDLLVGGTGKDTLTGGSGSDSFVFNTTLGPTTNVNRITDFNIAADTIRLDNAVMTGLGATFGTLSAAKFWKSASGIAHDCDDRIIYETDTGKLFYDSNGNSSGGSIHFASLAPDHISNGSCATAMFL